MLRNVLFGNSLVEIFHQLIYSAQNESSKAAAFGKF